MRLRGAWLLLLVGGCAAQAATAPASATSPAPRALAGRPALSEAECSQLFTRVFGLLVKDPMAEVGSNEFRLSFVEQCPSKFDRAAHFDCGMAARTRDEVKACMLPPVEQGAPPSDEAPPVECHREGPHGQVIVSARQFRARRGAGATRYSELTTSKEQPYETCGVGASLFELGVMTCDDGSRPFHTLDEVERARAGSVGEGGRCGTIIDEYKIACPEKSYDVFVDMYFCLPDAWPIR